MSVFGGAGNDLIDATSSAERARIYGGGGDDTLNFDSNSGGNEEAAALYGGYGDDTFAVDLTLKVGYYPQGEPTLSGGDGQDLFDLTVGLGNVDLEFPETDDTSRTVIEISDFQPGIDRLQLAADGAEISLSEAPDGTYTDVILTYPATASDPSVQGIIHLAGVTGLTLADIVLPAAA